MSDVVLEPTRRYELVTEEKSGGATYTPPALADFVAAEIVRAASPDLLAKTPLRVLDPAVGEGELLASLLEQLPSSAGVEVYGFDTNEEAVRRSAARLRAAFPAASIHLAVGDFLHHALKSRSGAPLGGLFEAVVNESAYDLIIANPPYVRTQIIGADQAQILAEHFGLSGRVDLYHAFILAMAEVLSPHGVAGVILSNRFMTTQAGATVRRAILGSLRLRHVWDLGDTKLFEAAVLPAVILAGGRAAESRQQKIRFTSIYETTEPATSDLPDVIGALKIAGVAALPDGRSFRVQQGTLDDSSGTTGLWRIATKANTAWLETVARHTWRTFGQIGKVRVGVKTCADRVFIGTHWTSMAASERPELLRPLATHHTARRFRALETEPAWQVLYPHETHRGRRRPVDLAAFPKTRRYLERHREALAARQYVTEAGREWYEIWVPQDPAEWSRPKLVFRDISERPCFWIDRSGTVVNGDCYWMTCHDQEDEDLLWLALAVANSTFIERFYDHRFNNKLYAGRRRFITQYVAHFPIPDPQSKHGRALSSAARAVYETTGTNTGEELALELDRLVSQAFGLELEEVAGQGNL